MSVEHCGQDRDTPYCPECGKRLEENLSGIQGLKRHVDSRVEAVRRDAEKEERQRPSDICCERAKKNLVKWEKWQAALKELMDG